MATFRAVSAVCDAIIQLLRANYPMRAFDSMEVDFRVYGTHDFSQPVSTGITLYLYRITPYAGHRTPQGRVTQGGGRQAPRLPIALHFLLTVWAKDALLQHALAGWMMRVLEDFPTLTAAQLNGTYPETFPTDETVDIVLDELSTHDLNLLWDGVTDSGYQLSVPYTARVLLLESTQALPSAAAIAAPPAGQVAQKG